MSLKKAFVSWLLDDLHKSAGREVAVRGDYGNPITPFQRHSDNVRFQEDLLRTCVEAALAYDRAPDAPRFVPCYPKQGVPMVRNEEQLLQVLAMVSAAVFMKGQWPSHQFYYWAKLPNLRESRPWRAVEGAARQHGMTPALMREPNVYVFGGMDWWLAEVRFVMGTHSTSHQLIAAPIEASFEEWR